MILATFLGILGSVVPEIVDFFKRRDEYKHEARMFELRIQAATQAAKHQLDIENVRADINEGKSLRDHDSSIHGGRFMDALRASVRPVVTYIFFFAFLAVKFIGLYYGLSFDGGITSQLSVVEILPLVWDTDTQAIFGAILGFWFGSRTIDKLRTRGYLTYDNR